MAMSEQNEINKLQGQVNDAAVGAMRASGKEATSIFALAALAIVMVFLHATLGDHHTHDAPAPVAEVAEVEQE